MKKFTFLSYIVNRYHPKDLGHGWWGVMDAKTGELIDLANGDKVRLPAQWASEKANQLNEDRKP